MLDRFTADLGTIAATPGFAASGNLTDALIAFAMQGYYSGPHAADANRQMLEAVSGGIHLDRGDIAGSQAAFMLGAGNTDNLTGGTQADLLIGLAGNDILAGEVGRATKRHVCHIDASCERQYPASIPDPCAHGPANSPNERPLAAAFPAAARIGTEIGTMKPAKRGTFAKVSRGGTPGNEAWRQAA